MKKTNMKMWLVLAMAAMPFCSLRAQDDISIDLLSQSKKVIPIYYQQNDFWVSNIKLPAIVIRNRSSRPATAGTITIVGKSGGKEVLRNTVDMEAVGLETARFGKALNKLIAAPQNKYLPLNVRYGRVRVPERAFMEGPVLSPGDIAALNLFGILNFQFCGKEKLDTVALQLELWVDEKMQTIEYQLPLTPYQALGKYSFPIRGACTISSLPLGFSHRSANSQEFAIDILDLRRIAAGEFSTSRKPGGAEHRVVQTSDTVEDYFIFNREVLAIADGVVAAMENHFPDRLALNPQENFIERLNALTPQLEQQGVSLQNIRTGNYIVLDHLNGEFSYYCHLRQNILVRPGEKVKKGQVLARIGNSGNSSEPHLHFQLMDGADFTTANGLPIVFEDINLETSLDSPFFGDRNCLLYSEFIFTFTE